VNSSLENPEVDMADTITTAKLDKNNTLKIMFYIGWTIKEKLAKSTSEANLTQFTASFIALKWIITKIVYATATTVIIYLPIHNTYIK